MHPERTPDPQALRWVVGAGHLPFTGVVTQAPGQLGAYLDSGLISDIITQIDAVVIRLRDGHSWRVDGEGIRAALREALNQPQGWIPLAGSAVPADSDQAIRDAAQAIIDGPIGEITHLHGGAFALDGVTQGVVSVRMEGACKGCSISALTLQARFGKELRRACPWVKEIIAVS